MTKTQIKKDLLQGNGGSILISISAVAKLTKMSRDRASILLKDLQYDPRGKATTWQKSLRRGELYKDDNRR